MHLPAVSRRPSQTKIIATLGPATNSREKIKALVLAGVDVFRLNMAHGSFDEHQIRINWIRDIEKELRIPLAVLADLGGPKIRLGELKNGVLECLPGMTVRLVEASEARDDYELPVAYPHLLAALQVGDRIVLADGMVSLKVVAKSPEAAICEVVQTGIIRSRQGVNLPGVKLPVSALTEADRQALDWALKQGVDFIGLSFVRSPDDILELRNLLDQASSYAQIVAKIEKPEALDHLDHIISLADAVMVARGDLGVETNIAEVAVVQKRILQTAERLGKPAIVATQMLESMQRSRIPTRAEVSDITNAILDGADACMLSGETAIGQYPIEAVTMMHQIALVAEAFLATQSTRPSSLFLCEGICPEIMRASIYHAGHIARQLGAKMLIVASQSGRTALTAAKHRFPVPTIGVSASVQTLRRMCLYWGVIPLMDAPLHDATALFRYVTQWGNREGLLKPKDPVVLVYGMGLAPSAHNTISVFLAE